MVPNTLQSERKPPRAVLGGHCKVQGRVHTHADHTHLPSKGSRERPVIRVRQENRVPLEIPLRQHAKRPYKGPCWL